MFFQISTKLAIFYGQLLLGEEGQTKPEFKVKNKRLKELCKRVDQLKSEDQEVICHFLDLAIRHEQLRQIVHS